MKIQMRTLAGVGLSAGLLAGCATVTVAPPVMTYTRTGCAAAPDLATATSLTPDKEKAVYLVKISVGPQSPCLSRAGGPTPYVLYALPADTGDKTFTVGGSVESARVFSPEVSILGPRGEVVRTFQPTDYYFRGPVYSVQFRPREGEAYVLVAADTARVGKRFDAIAIGTSTMALGTGGTWTMGVESNLNRAFSYEGAAEVTVYDSDIKEALKPASP